MGDGPYAALPDVPRPIRTPVAPPSNGPDPLPGPTRPALGMALGIAAPPGADQAWDLTGGLAAASLTAAHGAMVVVAVLMAGFGALAMASLLGYSPTRLGQLLEERGGRPCGPDRSKRDPEYLILAAAFTAGGWLLGLWSVHAAVAPDHFGSALLTLSVVMLLVTCLAIAFAQHRPERALLAAMPWLRPTWLVLRWPLVLPLLGLTRIVRWSRSPATEQADAAEVQEQVMAAVDDSVSDPLPAEERTWIGNIVGLKDLPVSTLMTPRPDIVGLPETMTVRDAVQKALDHGFSRYPVYRDRIDEVVGVFNVKDALRLLHEDSQRAATTPLRSLLREVLFAPETSGAAQLLRRFQASNQHLAIVIDEYGTTVGLVTVEDVLEAIVGDIGDEYDAPAAGQPEPDAIRVVEAGRVLELPARATAAELNRLLHTDLPEQGDFETLAGLVIGRLNHIPAVNETVVIDGVEFRVVQADERRIQRLRATLLAPQPAAEETG